MLIYSLLIGLNYSYFPLKWACQLSDLQMCLFCSCRSFLKFGVRTGRRKSSWWPKTMLNLFQKVSDFCLFICFLSSWRDRMLHSQIINIYIFKSSRPLRSSLFTYIQIVVGWVFFINYEAVCRIKKKNNHGFSVLVDCETVAFDRPFHGFISVRGKLFISICMKN